MLVKILDKRFLMYKNRIAFMLISRPSGHCIAFMPIAQLYDLRAILGQLCCGKTFEMFYMSVCCLMSKVVIVMMLIWAKRLTFLK